MDKLLILINQTNIYLQQNERNFHNSAAKMKAFIGANQMMTLNQLSSIQIYLDCDCNFGLQNIFTRTIYKELLKNLHFADNTKQDKTYKRLKDWTNNLWLELIIWSSIFKWVWAKYWSTYDKIQRTFLNNEIIQNTTYKMDI